LNEKTQRYLAIAIFFLLIIILILIVAIPVINLNNHYSDKIQDMAHRMAILKRTSVEGEKLKPQYEKLKRSHNSDERYLKSTSAPLAAAEIQRIVKEIIVPTDGEILSTQIIKNTKEEVIPQITLKVRLRSNLRSLVTILHEIETSNPYLFVEDINIRSRVIRRRKRLNDSTSSPTLLDVQFEVSGYIRGSER
jgi:general secretion pathway protein M